VRSPKVYIRDSGLTHALLDLETWEDILGHPVAGASWEAFVLENLIAAAGDRRTPYFYRTEDGAEIDLLFELGGKIEMAIEIKRTTAPTLSRGFHLARDAVKPRNAFVVHGGEQTWPMGDGITAMGVVDMMRKLADA
jgi:predicted AAA+ superfamily ATPase